MRAWWRKMTLGPHLTPSQHEFKVDQRLEGKIQGRSRGGRGGAFPSETRHTVKEKAGYTTNMRLPGKNLCQQSQINGNPGKNTCNAYYEGLICLMLKSRPVEKWAKDPACSRGEHTAPKHVKGRLAPFAYGERSTEHKNYVKKRFP